MFRSARSGGRLGFVRTLNYLAFAPLAARAPMYARLLWALLRDDRIPSSQKAVVGLAAGYLVLPFDLIPEVVPVVGRLDDVAVIVLALDIFLENVSPELLDEKLAELEIDRAELERDLRQVRRYVPRPLRRAFLRLPDAIEGVASLMRDAGVDRRLRAFLESAGDSVRAERARRVGGPDDPPLPARPMTS